MLSGVFSGALAAPRNAIPFEIVQGVDIVEMGALGVGLAAVVLAAMGKKAGLIAGAATTVVFTIYALWLRDFPLETWAFWNIFWTAAMVAVGFGFEPLVARMGVRLYRLDRNVLMGAAIGMIVALFVGTGTSGLTLMVLGALLGAMAGGLFSGVAFGRSFKDAVGALLGLFGPEGIRLMTTLAVVALVVQTARLVP